MKGVQATVLICFDLVYLSIDSKGAFEQSDGSYFAYPSNGILPVLDSICISSY